MKLRPLFCHRPLFYHGCGKCLRCVESCPAEAFTGRRFAEEEPREARMDSMKCHNYPSKMEEDKGARVCASCVAVCPFGKK